MALDWYQIASLIIAVLFGGQGIHSWLKTREAKRQHALAPTEEQANLALHYEKELAILRGNQVRELEAVKRDNARLRKRNETAENYIDELQTHIWERKGPPPPRRTESKD